MMQLKYVPEMVFEFTRFLLIGFVVVVDDAK